MCARTPMFQAIGLGDLRLDLAPAPFKGRARSLEIGRYTRVANASARCWNTETVHCHCSA
jgi:hypothetical protein